jgi:UDP-N-acetylmuramoylalanine--D-glutamate ligase
MEVMTANLIASSHRRLVLGLGETGRSVVRHFQTHGIPCVAADSRASLQEDAGLSELLSGVDAFFGDLPLDLADDVEEIIASPGVPLDHPLLLRAAENGVRIRGDIDLFMEQANAPVIGITGSNGKSTVTALVGHLLTTSGVAVAIGGNLGKPALDLLDDAVACYVLELSSFQLERAEPLGLAVATVLNLTPDHLDRHGSMATYQQAKHRIFRGARSVVSNSQDPLTAPLLAVGTRAVNWRLGEPDLGEFGIRSQAGARWFSHGFEMLAPVSDFPLAGEHNIANALAALAIGHAAGVAAEELVAGLSTFKGLPHRTMVVGDDAGVRFVDDSKATNVGATQAALNGLAPEGSLVLIAGGQPKGQDFAPLCDLVARYCRAVVLLGEASEALATVLAGSSPVIVAESMEDAVAKAAGVAEPGDTVLLSPACASFDMFDGYAARGRAFSQAVARLLEVSA